MDIPSLSDTEPESTRHLNILCLDGGGVRGLSSLLILRTLMEQLQLRLKSDTELRPCEVFDMICGTSTGGLIAIMLGRLKMTVEEAITSYLDFSRTVFGRRKSESQFLSGYTDRFRKFIGRGKSGTGGPPIYDASELEKWVMGIVAEHEGDGQASLQDPGDGTHQCCRTFVVAVTQVYADSPPKLFRTFRMNGKPADTCKIWEAVRATTAAFPFFESAKFGTPPQTYIDGSFSGANNPSQLAVEEAHDVFPSRKIGCFLSLGTGVQDVIGLSGGPQSVAEACMKLIKSCELVHNSVEKGFSGGKANAHGDPYFRFSVDRGLDKIQLDEWNQEELLAAVTAGYMRYYRQEEQARKCVETLMTRATEVVVRKEDELTLQ